MQNIRNKTAIITGGTKGIGYGIAEAMLREDMNVLITGRSDSSVKSALSKLRDIGKGKVEGKAADVRDLSAMKATADYASKHFGGIDILIANAGIGHFGSIEEITEEQWRETIDVNLTGVFNSVKASLDKLKESDSPYLITIASLAGTNFFAGGSAYNASKFGLVGFTQAIMLDLRHKGINVSTIMPGSVATHFNDHTPTEADSWKIQPEDLGKMVIDLLKMDPRTLPSKIEVRPSRPSKS